METVDTATGTAPLNINLKHILHQIVERQDLLAPVAHAVMVALIDGTATPIQAAALLTALRMKGESVSELTGFAQAMRARAVAVPVADSHALLDTCGTGGDTCKTFNISTASAFVASAGGARVAKHGNRSVTGVCGSADVLEACGVRLDLSPAQVGACVDMVGIGFLFARNHHPAMRHIAPVRGELGIRTIFNLLGPLTNPAQARHQLIGVYDPHWCEPLAHVLRQLGSERALVVHGEAGNGLGLDEIGTFGTTVVAELNNGQITTYQLTPESLGVPTALPADVGAGHDIATNATFLQAVLSGEDTGPRAAIVQVNAGAALYVAGLVATIRDGVVWAGELLRSGAGGPKLEALRKFTHAIQEGAT